MAKKKKQNRFLKHLKSLGFTNRLAIYILIFLAAGLAGGFYLAVKSITYGFNGSLLCWTVVFTPLGTVSAAVIGRVVDKSKHENLAADGTGLSFAAAQARGFIRDTDDFAIMQNDDDLSGDEPTI